METQETPKPTPDEILTFKQLVTSWAEYDCALKKLQAAVSERRVAMRALSKKIVQFMKTHQIDELNTREGGRIVLSSRQTRAPIRVHDIQERLSALAMQGHTTVDVFDLTKSLFDQPRAITLSDSLRRVVPKVTTRLDI